MGVGRGDSSDQVERQRQKSTKAWTNYLLKAFASRPSATPATYQAQALASLWRETLGDPWSFCRSSCCGSSNLKSPSIPQLSLWFLQLASWSSRALHEPERQGSGEETMRKAVGKSEVQSQSWGDTHLAEPETQLWDNLGLREPKGGVERGRLPFTKCLLQRPHCLRECYSHLMMRIPAQRWGPLPEATWCVGGSLPLLFCTRAPPYSAGILCPQVPAPTNTQGLPTSGMAWAPSPGPRSQRWREAAVAILTFPTATGWHCGDITEPLGPVSIWPWPLSQKFGKSAWIFKTAESTAGSHWVKSTEPPIKAHSSLGASCLKGCERLKRNCASDNTINRESMSIISQTGSKWDWWHQVSQPQWKNASAVPGRAASRHTGWGQWGRAPSQGTAHPASARYGRERSRDCLGTT